MPFQPKHPMPQTSSPKRTFPAKGKPAEGLDKQKALAMALRKKGSGQTMGDASIGSAAE